jgi:hypothetical protein
LGHLQAESVLGPKIKFVHLSLLYIFHLETKVIRALQQRVIKPQTASVSVLTATSNVQIDGENEVKLVPSFYMLFSMNLAPTSILGSSQVA